MWCSSQNTYPKLTNDSLIVITPQQLKATNLIFLEHKKFKREIPELNNQIVTYETLIQSYVQSDSIQNVQIERLKTYSEHSEQVMQNQLKEISKLETKNKLLKGLTIGGITASAVLLLTVFLK